jgi:hypothetical protein
MKTADEEMKPSMQKKLDQYKADSAKVKKLLRRNCCRGKKFMSLCLL